jgi:[ribosomal protein S5]-alanine N-acetyltransferase
MDIPLAGARLRPYRLEDAASVARYANDRSVWRNLRDGFPHPYTPDDFVTFFRRLEEEAKARPELHGRVFAIEVDGEAVGACGVHPLTDVYSMGAEVGYWLGRPSVDAASPPRRCGR